MTKEVGASAGVDGSPASTAWGARGPAASREASPVIRGVCELTDEELSALCGDEQGVVASPYLRRLSADERETARSVALRSLCARGIVRLDAQADRVASGDTGARTMLIEGEVADALARRRDPEAVLAVHRLSAGPEGAEALMRYVFVRGDELLVEDVSSFGLHRFARAAAADLAWLMRVFLDPGAPWSQGGPPEPAGADRPASGPALRDPGRAGEAGWPEEFVPLRDGSTLLAGVHLVAEMVVRRDDSPLDHTHTAYVFPQVAYVGRALLDDPRSARLSRLPTAELGRWAADLLCGETSPQTRAEGPAA